MNKSTTYEISPTFPTFSTSLGIVANKNNNIQTPTTTGSTGSITPAVNPIVIQMPSFPFPYSQSNTSIHPESLPTTNCELPSINEFLLNLDAKYNCNNIYIKIEAAFLEEEITVNAIKDLSD